jgi:Papain-like cysteine protease AvrRpt2
MRFVQIKLATPVKGEVAMVSQLLSASRYDLGQTALSAHLGKLFFVSSSLPFNMQAQTQTQWCWAATATSVSHFYFSASSWTQCLVANGELSRGDCCTAPVPSPCNVSWYLDRALTRTSNFQSMVSGTITFDQIKAEIGAGRPIGARIGWSGGGGHFMVIYGCSTVGATQYVDIDDPIYGKSHPTLSTFTSNYQGSGTWTHTYFTKRWPVLKFKLPILNAKVVDLIKDHSPLLDVKQGSTQLAAKPGESLVVPHHVYVVGLNDLSRDNPVPEKPAALRVFAMQDQRSRALFEFTPDAEGAPQLQSMSDDAQTLSVSDQALTQAERIVETGGGEPELRLVRVPALYVEAYWLRYPETDKDVVIPIRALGLFSPLQTVPARDFFAKLRAAAQERLRTSGDPAIAP